MKIAVNGLGRMGRLFLRAAHERGLLVSAVHEPKGTPANLALGLQFDSVHGRWSHTVTATADALRIGEHGITLVPTADWRELPWRRLGIDLVVECSGKSKTRDAAQAHIAAGARRVLVSNPVPDVPNLVYGVNHATCDFAREPIVTAASCTTNCLAPLVRVLHDRLGIVRGLVTTIHDPTNTQVVVDRPDSDPRRGRSALLNLIPTSTNSATAVARIVPELAGRLDSLAVRAPVLNASLVDAVLHVARPTTVAEVNGVLREAAERGPLHGILGYEDRPLVSSDFVHDPRSAIVDSLCTRVVDGELVKVLAWYDNEWGYVQRMVDLALCVREALR
jgi:glyceraldehyde 3-phosphate dehydrogenase